MVRSRSEERVRVAMTAGTVQPKPMSIGTMDLPERPIFRSSLSITKATRAI
ncbi:unknown [Firmicutes bacterium CAG:170]|nr:unknown [Firmicutes bacterium CAG:170]